MRTDYHAYPPQVAADVEVTEQRDGGRPAFIIGSAASGRYILLRETEYKVLGLLGASLAPGATCSALLLSLMNWAEVTSYWRGLLRRVIFA